MNDDGAVDGAPLLRSRLVWDMVNHESASVILSKMGMVPPSIEGQEIACAESHERLELTAPFDPAINLIAETLAEIVVTALIGDLHKDLDPQTQDQVVMFYRTILGNSARTVIANLMDSNVLTYQKVT